MLVLGLLLILLAVGLFLGFLAAGTQEVSFESGVLDVTVNSLTVYLLGALTLLLLVAGLAMLRVGMRRASQRRADRKELSRLSAKEAEEAGPARDGDTTGTRVGRGDTGTTPAPTTDSAPETAAESTTKATTGTTTSSMPPTAETPTQANDADPQYGGGGTTRA